MGAAAVRVRFGEERIWDLLHGPFPLVPGDPALHPGKKKSATVALWVDPDDPDVWIAWSADTRWHTSLTVASAWRAFCRGKRAAWPAICAAMLFLRPTAERPPDTPRSALHALRGVAGLLAPRTGPFAALSQDAAGPAAEVWAAPVSREWLRRHPDRDVRLSLARRINAGAGTDGDILGALAHDHDPEVREVIADSPAAPPKSLATLAQDPRAEIRQKVARRRDTPPETLTALAEDPDTAVWSTLIANPSTPAATLTRLAAADREAAWLRWRSEELAWWRRLPAAALRALTEHPNLAVRACAREALADEEGTPAQPDLFDPATWPTVAGDPATSVAVLDELVGRAIARLLHPVRNQMASDRSAAQARQALLAIAENPNATAGQLQRIHDLAARHAEDLAPAAISSEGSWAVATLLDLAVAAHPRTPPGVLARLAGAGVGKVRAAARLTQHALRVAPEEYTRAFAARQVQAFARTHPVPPEDPEVILATSVSVRMRSASYPHSPVRLLTSLAFDPDPVVRREVAKNPATPPELLPTLAGDPDTQVRVAIAANLATSPQLLPALAADPDTQVRVAIAANPATPPEVLPTLAADPGEQVRLAVAANDHTDEDILAAMARTDPSLDIVLRIRWERQPSPDSALGHALAERLAPYPLRLECYAGHVLACLVPVFADLLATTADPTVPGQVIEQMRAAIHAGSWIRVGGYGWCEYPAIVQTLPRLDEATTTNPHLDMTALWDEPRHALWHEGQDILRGTLPACPRCGE